MLLPKVLIYKVGKFTDNVESLLGIDPNISNKSEGTAPKILKYGVTLYFVPGRTLLGIWSLLISNTRELLIFIPYL